MMALDPKAIFSRLNRFDPFFVENFIATILRNSANYINLPTNYKICHFPKQNFHTKTTK